jgi:hypothetical protein
MLGIKSPGTYAFHNKFKTIDMVHEKEYRLCYHHWFHSMSMLSVECKKKEHQFEGVEIIARTDPFKEEGRLGAGAGKFRVGGDQ